MVIFRSRVAGLGALVVSVAVYLGALAAAGDDVRAAPARAGAAAAAESGQGPVTATADTGRGAVAVGPVTDGRGRRAGAPRAVPGEVLVRYVPGVRARGIGRARRRGEVEGVRHLGLRRAELARTRPGQSIAGAIAALESDPAVMYAEPNYIDRILALEPPDDEHFDLLWGLHNTGQAVPPGEDGVKGTEGSDIDALAGWEMASSSQDAVVAVLDSGVDVTHPDLSGRIWSNEDEIADTDDTDENGYPDDVMGWDFIDGDADVRDRHGHGTHVAGTIGATPDNGIGVSGVGWDATVMPLRICDVNGFCPVDRQVDAIEYARENGASIVNLSIGGPNPSQARRDQIELSPDVLFVAAAGNEGSNNDASAVYPCQDDEELTNGEEHMPALSNLICVAASDSSDRLAGFSNYGAGSVDLAAPGRHIASAVPSFATPFDDAFDGSDQWEWDAVAVGASPEPDRWELIEGPELSGGRSVTDSRGTDYEPGTTAIVRLQSGIDLGGFDDCSLGYRYKLDAAYETKIVDGEKRIDWEQSAVLLAQVADNSADPGAEVPADLWRTVDGTTGGNGEIWWYRRAPLGGLSGSESLELRFALKVGAKAKRQSGATIDEVAIRCLETVDSGSARYVYSSGTSMATPHVSGVASIVREAFPTLGPAQVKDEILEGVDPLQDLKDKSVSGGRLNLASTLGLLGLEPTDADGGDGGTETGGDGGGGGDSGSGSEETDETSGTDGSGETGTDEGSESGDGSESTEGSESTDGTDEATSDESSTEPAEGPSEAAQIAARVRILAARSFGRRGWAVIAARTSHRGWLHAAALYPLRRPLARTGEARVRWVPVALGRTPARRVGNQRIALRPTRIGARLMRRGPARVLVRVVVRPVDGTGPGVAWRPLGLGRR